MDSLENRDEEAKVRFLLEAVRETEWGIRYTSHVTDINSYQGHISAMNTSHRDLALFRRANNKENDSGQHQYMRKSLFKTDDRKQQEDRDTLYAWQGRYGLHPNHIDRSVSSEN